MGPAYHLTLAADQSLHLAWDASSDRSVSGYIVHYGPASGVYSLALDVQTNTTATINGLLEGSTYFFVVTAYNGAGQESNPSNEITFIAPGIVEMVRRAHSTTPAHIRFPVVPGQTYSVEATRDFRTWIPIWQVTGTTNAWVEYADPQAAALSTRFYRVHHLQ